MPVVLSGYVTSKIDAAFAIAPLVVIPANQLEEAAAHLYARAGVEDARAAVMDEISRNDFIFGITKDTFEVSLACLFHGGADFLVGRFFHCPNREVHHTDGRSRHAEGHPGGFSFFFW